MLCYTLKGRRLNNVTNYTRGDILKKILHLFRWIIDRLFDFMNVPVWLLSKVIPKDDNIWVFGSWHGRTYSDNPKSLFEYVRSYEPQIRAIWLTKNLALLQYLRGLKAEAYFTYSVRGYWYSARARVGIVCVGFDDINRFVPPPVTVNTWHGTPVKKIGQQVLDFRNEASPISLLKSAVRKLMCKMDPFYDLAPGKRYTCFLAESKIEAQLLRKSFGDVRVEVTGQPRVDLLCTRTPANDGPKHALMVLYLPTHRFEGMKPIVPSILPGIQSAAEVLRQVNGEMFIKLHEFDEYESEKLRRALKFTDRINVITNDEIFGDIYPLLAESDILITDYSSVYVDYLVTGKPIIFFPFDFDSYVQTEREFNFEYEAVTPGPKCRDWRCVSHWINEFSLNPMLYSCERRRLALKFHEYFDGYNCSRAVDTIKHLYRLS